MFIIVRSLKSKSAKNSGNQYSIASNRSDKIANGLSQRRANRDTGIRRLAGISARDADPSNYLNWIELGRVYDPPSR